MAEFRLTAFFLVGICQFSFAQLRQQDGQKVEQSDDFGTAAARDPSNLWQGTTEPPATGAPCLDCAPSPSDVNRSGSRTQSGVSPEQASLSSQKPLPPTSVQAAELSDAAQSAASAGDWTGAIKAINAAVSLSPDDLQLRQQENVLLKMAPKHLKNEFNTADPARHAHTLMSSNQTDSTLPEPQGTRPDQESSPRQLPRPSHSEGSALPRYQAASLWESNQIRSASQKTKIGDYAGAENILETVLHRNSGNWTAHTLLAKAFLSQTKPDYKGARIEAIAALDIHGNDSEMLQVLASALIHIVPNETAVNNVERYLSGIADKNKRTAEAHFILSQAYREDKQHLEELNNLSVASSYDPKQFSRLYEQARSAYDHQTNEREPNKIGYPRWGLVVGALLLLAGIAAVLRQMFHYGEISPALRKARLSAASLPTDRHTPADTGKSWCPGSCLNENFDVIKLLGQGGMGEVYLAFDKSLGRNVAIKRMRPAISQIRRDRERFLREARNVSKLDSHLNIVRIHHILEMPNELALVFEYIDGETLSQILERKQRLPFDEACRYLKPVCDALKFAHRHAIYHRDIKPSNIMLSKDGVLKVMDFGIAREAKTAMGTLTNTVMGTPPYMAPEMEMGFVGKEADIYSLGVTLYELLSGETPFAGASANEDKKNMNFRPLSMFVQGMPAGIDEFIAHALHPDPAHRLKSADEFLAGLDDLSLASRSDQIEKVRGFSSIHGITPSHRT